jgi:t-SNARE complex subunit (syntaxin)
MSTKKDYENRCFSPNWLEVDLEEVARQQVKREDRLESKRRKDLKTLLKELDEIKQNIERVAEKQHRLANLMGFYSGEFAQ